MCQRRKQSIGLCFFCHLKAANKERSRICVTKGNNGWLDGKSDPFISAEIQIAQNSKPTANVYPKAPNRLAQVTKLVLSFFFMTLSHCFKAQHWRKKAKKFTPEKGFARKLFTRENDMKGNCTNISLLKNNTYVENRNNTIQKTSKTRLSYSDFNLTRSPFERQCQN